MKRKTDRRTVLNRIIYIWGAVTSLPVIAAIIDFIYPPVRAFVGEKVIGTVNELQPNTSTIVQLGERPVIVITKGTGETIAFGANCTHLGCVVRFREERGDIYCACHYSVFNIEGQPVSGPANRPLEEIPVKIVNDQIAISAAQGKST